MTRNRSPYVVDDAPQVLIVDDLPANLLALETDAADYETMNIGTGRATTVQEIAELLAKGLGKQIRPQMVGKYREGDIRHCVADITKARKLLGYEPKVSLEDGLVEIREGHPDGEPIPYERQGRKIVARPVSGSVSVTW